MKKLKLIINIVLFVIAIGLLGFTIYKAGLDNLYQNLLNAEPLLLILSVIMTLFMFGSWGLKWWLMVRKLCRCSFDFVMVTLWAGSYVNTTTPAAGVGGEPVRAYFVKKKYGVSKTKVMGTILADKAASTIAFSTLSLLSILFVLLFLQINMTVRIVLEVILAIFVLVGFAGALLHMKLKKKHLKLMLSKLYGVSGILRRRFPKYDKLEGKLVGKLESVVVGTKEHFKKEMRSNLFLSFMMWVFNYLSTWFLFKAFGFEIGWLPMLIVVTLSILVGSVVSIPGGMGVIEMVMISLYLALGVDVGAAATVAVIDRLKYYLLSIGVGGVCMGALSWKYK